MTLLCTVKMLVGMLIGSGSSGLSMGVLGLIVEADESVEVT